MTALVARVAARVVQSAFYRNRFYGMGLALQKGLPVLLVPLILAIGGKLVYGEYVLFYTVVQMYAALTSFGAPQAIVPLWFRQAQPEDFMAAVVGLIYGFSALVAVPGVLLAFKVLAPEFHAIDAWSLGAWMVAFSALYNANALAIGFARVRGRQQRFFWSIAVGAAVLVACLLALYLGRWNTLAHLIAVQVLTLLVSTAILVYDDLPTWVRATPGIVSAHFRPLLRAALPMYAYTLVVIYALSVDKWVLKLWFPLEGFTAYVLDYQFAFAILFVPTAMSFHLGSRFSELAAGSRHDEIRALERKARRLTVWLGIASALAVYLYARLAGVHLTGKYWILAFGFLVHGVYLLVSSRLMANLNFGAMLTINIMSAGMLTVVLLISGFLQVIEIAYGAWIGYSTTALLLSRYYQRNFSGQAAAAESGRMQEL